MIFLVLSPKCRRWLYLHLGEVASWGCPCPSPSSGPTCCSRLQGPLFFLSPTISNHLPISHLPLLAILIRAKRPPSLGPRSSLSEPYPAVSTKVR